MADKPISFSAPMIRALLDGRKTQTRRMLKDTEVREPYVADGVVLWDHPDGPVFRWERTPALGDWLWVCEAWRVFSKFDRSPPRNLHCITCDIEYIADQENPPFDLHGRTRSSIHMPRWASRLTLTVTDVRVQRLQGISEEDAIAEGASRVKVRDGVSPSGAPFTEWSTRDGFRDFWNSLHADPKPVKGADGRVVSYISHPWENIKVVQTYRGKPWHLIGNPWVVALTFDVHRCNIDQMEQNDHKTGPCDPHV